jgi:hypothetical protein
MAARLAVAALGAGAMSITEFLAEYGTRLLSGAVVTMEQAVLASILAVAIATLMGLTRPEVMPRKYHVPNAERTQTRLLPSRPVTGCGGGPKPQV